VYLRDFYRIVNAFVAKYLSAAVGRDVLSVAKKSDCHAPCIFFGLPGLWSGKNKLGKNLSKYCLPIEFPL
jgi:hypothetical protein